MKEGSGKTSSGGKILPLSIEVFLNSTPVVSGFRIIPPQRDCTAFLRSGLTVDYSPVVLSFHYVHAIIYDVIPRSTARIFVVDCGRQVQTNVTLMAVITDLQTGWKGGIGNLQIIIFCI